MEGDENGKNYLGSESVNPDFGTVKSLNNDNQSTPTRSSASSALKSAESAAANPISSTSADAKSAEENTPFKSSVTGRPNEKDGKKRKGLLRRAGPALSIGGISVFAFIGFSAIFSPFLQLNHIITMATEKWGFSEYTLTRRSQQIFGLKTVGSKTPLTTGGALGTNIGNRYRTVSTRTLNRLESNGFKIDSSSTTLTGKHKISNISYGDKTFNTPKEFTTALRQETGMRTDLNRVYKPRVAQMFDTMGEKFKAKFGLKKFFAGSPKIDADGDMMTALQDNTRSTDQGTIADSNSATQSETQNIPDPDNPDSTITTEVDVTVNSVEEPLRKAPSLSGNTTALNVLKALNILGAAQAFCGYYQMAHGLTSMIKTSGLDQIATSVAQAFSVGDQVKAGSGDSDAISAINTSLNTPTSYTVESNESGDTTKYSDPKTGSSAQAYQTAVQSTNITERSQIDGSASKYLMGGIPPFFQNMYQFLTGNIGSSIGSVCNVITNPIIVGITTVASIALSFLTAGASATLSGALQGAPIMLINVGLNLLLPTIASIAAGDISCMFAKGQDMMNCLMIGFGGLAGKMAGTGGNTALTKDDAQAMYIDYQQYLAEVAEEERSTRSPFDASSPHTFLGSIASSFLPYYNNSTSSTSVTTPLSSIASVASSSITSLIPNTSAFTFNLSTFKDSLNVCDDNAYTGIATDPFCNPLYGAPNLEMDAEEILERLAESGQIEISEDGSSVSINETYPNGNTTGLYTYQKNCAERRIPLMMTIEGDDTSYGEECVSSYVFNDEPNGPFPSSIYALFFIDTRIQDAVDGTALLSLSDEFLDTAYNNNIGYYISDDPTSDMYIAGYYDNDDYEPTASDLAYATYVENQQTEAIALIDGIIEQAYLAQTGSVLKPSPAAPTKPVRISTSKPLTPEFVLYAPPASLSLSKSKTSNTTA